MNISIFIYIYPRIFLFTLISVYIYPYVSIHIYTGNSLQVAMIAGWIQSIFPDVPQKLVSDDDVGTTDHTLYYRNVFSQAVAKVHFRAREVCIYIYVYMCMCVYMCICVSIYVCICVSIYVCIYVYVCLYVYCICVCICICICQF